MQEICKRNEQNEILDSMITKLQELQKNWTPYGPHPTEKEMRNKDFNPDCELQPSRVTLLL